MRPRGRASSSSSSVSLLLIYLLGTACRLPSMSAVASPRDIRSANHAFIKKNPFQAKYDRPVHRFGPQTKKPRRRGVHRQRKMACRLAAARERELGTGVLRAVQLGHRYQGAIDARLG